MPRVLLVDNYYAPGKVIPLRDSLVSSGASVSVVGREGATAAAFDQHDGVVLSGSPAMLSESRTPARFEVEAGAVRRSHAPILGICFGHQLIAHAHGSAVVKAPAPTKRYVETEVLMKDELFSGLPRRVSVYESHSEIVRSVPDGFELTARSPTSPIAGFRQRGRPVVGVQFHPEKNSSANPDGAVFVGNFVKSLY